MSTFITTDHGLKESFLQRYSHALQFSQVNILVYSFMGNKYIEIYNSTNISLDNTFSVRVEISLFVLQQKKKIYIPVEY